LKQSQTPGVKADLRLPKPELAEIQQELRTIQGLLSVFAFGTVQLEHPDLEWLPESESEAKELSVTRFSMKEQPLPDDQISPLSFDLIARAIYSAASAGAAEIPLNFFRRGTEDIVARQYIEAFYDFYFVLETMFGDGQFRKAAIKRAFLSSPLFRSHVEESIKDPVLRVLAHRLDGEFERTYGSLSVEQATHRLVELRGELHHHTAKREGAWHPDEQKRYAVDALFLQSVAYKAVWEEVHKHLWDPVVVAAYDALREAHHRFEKPS
jgi:hypothetical protein